MTMNKSAWVTPRALVEEFEANEYVAACWGVGCNYTKANEYETSKGLISQVNHQSDHCGVNSNQVIMDYNDDNKADAMIETGTDGLGDLVCTIYTNSDYNVTKDVSTVRVGDYIYWTTSASDGRVWHHQGTVYATADGHPNRS